MGRLAMNVELPDGTVIEGVPEGTTKAQLAAKLRAAGKEVPAEWAAPPQQQMPVVNRQALSDRIAMGLGDPIHGGAQLLTKALPESVVQAGNNLNNWLADTTGLVTKLPAGGVDQAVREREQAYQQQRAAAGGTGIDWGRLAGNVINPVNLGIGGVAAGPTTLLGRVLAGAAAGGATSALTPVTEGDYAVEKAKQTGIGAAGGAMAPLLAAGIGRVISPKASTDPAIKLLKSEGVKPTVGQALGGAWNASEEKLQSVSVVGDAIRNSRSRAVEQLNNVAINRAMKPIGQTVKGAGFDAIKEAAGKIDDAYDAARAAMGHFQLDRQAARELMTLRSMASNLGERELRSFDKVWNYLDNAVSPNGGLRAEAYKQFDSFAGKEAAGFMGSTDAYQRQVGAAIKEMKRIVEDAGKRANPAAGELFQQADAAFANLVRVEEAAKRAVNTGGVFSPGQLGLAVRATDRSVRDKATAQGTALMQDLANAGQRVANKVPNSGTFDRAVLGGLTLGGGFLLNPMIAGGMLGGAALYTPPGQALLRGLVSARPAVAEPIASMLNQASPAFAPGLGLLGVNMLDQ